MRVYLAGGVFGWIPPAAIVALDCPTSIVGTQLQTTHQIHQHHL